MYFLFNLLKLQLLVVALCGIVSSLDDFPVMKEIVLDEQTPQGIIHLPPFHSVRSPDHLCHYWIPFLKDIPDAHKEDHKNYGISIRAASLELADEDFIEIIGVKTINNMRKFLTVTQLKQFSLAFSHLA